MCAVEFLCLLVVRFRPVLWDDGFVRVWGGLTFVEVGVSVGVGVRYDADDV